MMIALVMFSQFDALAAWTLKTGKSKTMSVNRFARQQWQKSASPSVAVAAPEGFVVCPSCMVSGFAAQAWAWHQEIFRIAYEFARASRAAAEFASRATTPDYQQRLFSNWN
jgi:hypothetical protein